MPKDPDRPARKRRNVAEKRAFASGALRKFVTQYERKAQKGHEPNDRRYDEKAERIAKRMKPARLDELLRDDEL